MDFILHDNLHLSYIYPSSGKLGKIWLGVGTKEKPTANPRELTRIAFSLRSGALLRLIACAESHPLWKNAGEKPARGFFFLFVILFLISGCGGVTAG